MLMQILFKMWNIRLDENESIANLERYKCTFAFVGVGLVWGLVAGVEELRQISALCINFGFTAE